MSKLNRFLLFCGIISTVIYIATDTIAATKLPGYSYINQSVSELSAVGASTRPFWVFMTFIFTPLFTAFGIGVIRVAKKISTRLTGILITMWGLSGFLWLFFPMHVRGQIGSTTDTMHLVMAGLTVFIIFLFVSVGSMSAGKSFRNYSYLTILAMLVFGYFVARQTPQVVAQLPTPWMGVMERISAFSPMIWMSVFARVLLSKSK
jgi:hypothetical protein